jgi:hypothetical protein
MNMKHLIAKMDAIILNEAINGIAECGDDMPPAPASAPSSDSVTMNVTMNGTGASGIRDLMNVLKDIQDGPDASGLEFGDEEGEEEFGDEEGEEEFGDEEGEEEFGDEEGEEEFGGDEHPSALKIMGATLDDDFANEPNPEYHDISAVTGSGNDLHGNQGDHRMRQTGLPVAKPIASEGLLSMMANLYQEIKLR